VNWAVDKVSKNIEMEGVKTCSSHLSLNLPVCIYFKLMKMYWWYMDCYKGIQKQNPSNGYNIY
jgi:hypothetical protein